MKFNPLASRLPIGVDIDGRFINAAQLMRMGDAWHVHAAVSMRREDAARPVSADEIGRLVDVLDRQGFHGRKIVLAMPREQMLSSVLDLPPRNSGAPIDQISRGELAAAHRCTPAEIEFDFWDVPKPNQSSDSSRVMAVGCLERDALALLDLFESSRLSVTAIDAPSCAVARALAPLGQANSLLGCLDIGWENSTFLVVAEEIVVFERELTDSGFKQVHESLVSEIGLDHDVADYLLTDTGLTEIADDPSQADLRKAVFERVDGFVHKLSAEMRLSIGYIEQEYGHESIGELLVVGEGAGVPELAEGLGRGCSLHASVVTPLQLGRCQHKLVRDCQSPVLTRAFGLAQHPGKGAR